MVFSRREAKFRRKNEYEETLFDMVIETNAIFIMEAEIRGYIAKFRKRYMHEVEKAASGTLPKKFANIYRSSLT